MVRRDVRNALGTTPLVTTGAPLVLLLSSRMMPVSNGALLFALVASAWTSSCEAEKSVKAETNRLMVLATVDCCWRRSCAPCPCLKFAPETRPVFQRLYSQDPILPPRAPRRVETPQTTATTLTCFDLCWQCRSIPKHANTYQY